MARFAPLSLVPSLFQRRFILFRLVIRFSRFASVLGDVLPLRTKSMRNLNRKTRISSSISSSGQFHFPRARPSDLPLTDELADSGHEIGTREWCSVSYITSNEMKDTETTFSEP